MAVPISRTSNSLTTTWTSVASNVASVNLCNQGSDQVYFALFAVGATAPTVAADRTGVIPVDNVQPITNAQNLAIYARAASGTATLLVEKYGD